MKLATSIAVAAFVLLATSGCQSNERPVWAGTVTSSVSPSPSAAPAKVSPPVPQVPERPVLVMPQGLPIHLTVVNPDGGQVLDNPVFGEGLDVNKNLSPNQDGAHEGQAAWFNEGTRATHPPGYPGSAIIAGHATKHGGTFHNLPAVKVGAIITVRYTSGDEVKFIVMSVVQDLKTAVTDDKTDLGRDIWGPASTTNLWLLSCDLTTDLVNGHRLGNVVVKSTLLSMTSG